LATVITASLTLVPAVEASPLGDRERERSAPKNPAFTWSPTSVTTTIAPGETTTLAVTFTASKNIRRASVTISPSLAPFLVADPSSFDLLAKAETRNLKPPPLLPTQPSLG